ncbi:MAG: zinc-ribbon domain-containing protein [Candidatus Stahlbacteria bacterium]|nr:zinc-ribbon domain-containing protein [Candidatus Stahlbacteria bacterium]
MRCQKCGTENPDDAVFCMKCGERVVLPKRDKDLTLKGKKGWLILCISVGIIILGIVGFQYIKSGKFKRTVNFSSKEEKVESATFEEVVQYVKPRLESGASTSVALGKYQGSSVRWRVQVNFICYGLSGTPVQFEKGCANILGHPSYGLDELKFRIFCEQHEGEWVTIGGKLLAATDNPIAVGPDKTIAFEIEVSGVEASSQNTYSQTHEQQSTETQNYENNQEDSEESRDCDNKNSNNGSNEDTNNESVHIDTSSAIGRSLAKIYGNRNSVPSDKKNEDVNFGNRTRVRSSIRRGSRR